MRRLTWFVLLLGLAPLGAKAQAPAEAAAPAAATTTVTPEPATATPPDAAAATPPASTPPATPPSEAAGSSAASAPANATPPAPSAVVVPAEPLVAPAGYVLVRATPAPPRPRARPVPRPPRRYGDAGAPFAFGLGGGFTWNDDRGYELVGDGAQGQLEVFASYDILQPVKPLVISLGLSFRHDRADSGDGLQELEVLNQTLQADLIARLKLASWLWPHARASLGGVYTRVNLSDPIAGDIRDRDLALASTFGGGLTLRTPTRMFESRGGKLASLSVGLLIEGGYSLASAASIRGTPGGGSDDIDRRAVSLGSLDRSGPYLRLLGVIRL